MSKVIAVINGSASSASKEQRVGSFCAELSFINLLGEVDTRPDARKTLSGSIDGATANQALLEATKQTLLALKRDGVAVEFVTNNDYVIGVLSRHWKPTKNADLIAEVKALMAKHSVTFVKFPPA
jgi:ribonuclease HI